ncbi:MAG: NADH-quinone oxidoreductase subunit NuoH [Planctomycetaceae bacterium]
MTPVLAASTLTDWIDAQGISWLPEWGPVVLAAVVHVILLLTFFGLPAGIFIWAERKVSARIQDRLGPTRVGGRFGWLQSLADGIKLLQKEDLAPADADKFLFRLAPYIVIVAAFSAFMFLPFSNGWTAVAMDCGLFVALAVLSMEVLGVVIAGYSSGSKWSLFGGMREAAQMVSYEVPLGLTAVIPVVVAGTMNLNDIGNMQQGWVYNWFVFQNPFTFLAFFVFFVATLASNKRAPFDLAEAESELVAGFITEYSGFRWSIFFLGEYAAMFFVSALGVVLFLGGWWTGIAPLDKWFVSIGESCWMGDYIVRVIGMKIFLVKSAILVCVQIWVRWTLPRLRIDQVMTTCLKYLVPIACFLFLGVVLYPLILVTVLGRTTLLPGSGVAMGERVPVPVVEASDFHTDPGDVAAETVAAPQEGEH